MVTEKVYPSMLVGGLGGKGGIVGGPSNPKHLTSAQHFLSRAYVPLLVSVRKLTLIIVRQLMHAPLLNHIPTNSRCNILSGHYHDHYTPSNRRIIHNIDEEQCAYISAVLLLSHIKCTFTIYITV